MVWRSGKTLFYSVDKVPCPAHRERARKVNVDLSVCSPNEESPGTDMAKDTVRPARASVQLRPDKAQEAGLVLFTGPKGGSANPTQVRSLIL